MPNTYNSRAGWGAILLLLALTFGPVVAGWAIRGPLNPPTVQSAAPLPPYTPGPVWHRNAPQRGGGWSRTGDHLAIMEEELEV